MINPYAHDVGKSGHRAWNACHCGRRKLARARQCIECTKTERLSRAPREYLVAKPGKLDYFPRGGRYGLLAVSGFQRAANGYGAKPGTTLTVVDGANMWKEIRRVYVPQTQLAKKRAELLADVRRLNKEDSRSGS